MAGYSDAWWESQALPDAQVKFSVQLSALESVSVQVPEEPPPSSEEEPHSDEELWFSPREELPGELARLGSCQDVSVMFRDRSSRVGLLDSASRVTR